MVEGVVAVAVVEAFGVAGGDDDVWYGGEEMLGALTVLGVDVVGGMGDHDVWPEADEKVSDVRRVELVEKLESSAEDVGAGSGFVVADGVVFGDGDGGGSAVVDVVGDGAAGPQLCVVGVGHDGHE